MNSTANQPLAIVTGASSGVGLYTVKALLSRNWRLILAVRNPKKMELVARDMGFNPSQFEIWHLDLSNLDSVRAFAQRFIDSGEKLNALLCNAATYLPLLKEPVRSPQGFEISVGSIDPFIKEWNANGI